MRLTFLSPIPSAFERDCQLAMRMLSTTRKLSKSYSSLPKAPLSISCHGKPITREDLFTYTNGHFLVDEEFQRSRRYVRFDLDALCKTVAASTAGGDTSPIIAIEKMEGGFSKAFLMRKANGAEVIAKIPCRIAGPLSLTTAGEVGVLEYGICTALSKVSSG